jgi:hypothetical protein
MTRGFTSCSVCSTWPDHALAGSLGIAPWFQSMRPAGRVPGLGSLVATTRPTATIRFSILFIFCLLCGCSHAGSLIGEWRSDSVTWSPPNATNRFEVYSTVTFTKEGSFQMHSFVNIPPRSELPVPLKGTYRLLDTNHMVLEVAPNDAFPSNKVPLTVSYSLVGDKLVLPVISLSVVTETRTYRRVKK